MVNKTCRMLESSSGWRPIGDRCGGPAGSVRLQHGRESWCARLGDWRVFDSLHDLVLLIEGDNPGLVTFELLGLDLGKCHHDDSISHGTKPGHRAVELDRS